MRLPRPTRTNQRVLGSAVVVLLAANAFAAAVIAGDRALVDPAHPPVVAPVSTTATRTITLITTRDGRRLVADPSTAAGRKAIADARRDGATTRELTVPTTEPATSEDGRADTGTSSGAVDRLIHDLTQGGTTVGGVLEVGKDVVDDLLKDPGATASSLVGSTQSTVTSVLGSTQSTVTSLVGSTQSTVTSVLGSTQSTVTSVLGQVTTPTTASLLGGAVTTVSSVVQQVTPTTAAPSPPTTISGGGGAVCSLLVHC